MLLCVVLPLTSGCYSWRVVKLPLHDIGAPAEEIIVSITMVDGRQIRFDPMGGWVRGQLVTGTVRGLPREFPLGEIEYFWVEREEIDTWRTIGAVLALGGVVALIVFGVAQVSDSETLTEIF